MKKFINVILILIVSTLNIVCFICGAKVGQETPVEPVQSEVVPPQKTPKKFGKKIWVPIVSVIGDFIFSTIKRYYGIK